MNCTPKQRNHQNNREIGTKYETIARNYLEEKGYHILCMNYRTRLGEIDIVAKDKTYTVFIEIKYRTHTFYGHPRESVGYYKQKKLIQVATHYLVYHQCYQTPIRFDVIDILGNRVTHIENAFTGG